ncbi:MAG: hypothetical protein WCF16_08485 [Alphaproteobacteria bacterium]
MTRKIAILGWGSLLWHPHAAFESRHGEWRFDGPWLPLEFTRVSPASKGGLTLVIDPVHGHPTRTAYCLSKRDTADEARRDLQEREWAKSVDLIGCFERNAGASADPSGGVKAAIADWAAAKDFDAVVWTAYPANFHEKTGTEFSVAAAIAYLKALPGEDQVRAVKYIHKAPPFIRTPLRTALLQQDWFNRLAEEMQDLRSGP